MPWHCPQLKLLGIPVAQQRGLRPPEVVRGVDWCLRLRRLGAVRPLTRKEIESQDPAAIDQAIDAFLATCQ